MLHKLGQGVYFFADIQKVGFEKGVRFAGIRRVLRVLLQLRSGLFDEGRVRADFNRFLY